VAWLQILEYDARLRAVSSAVEATAREAVTSAEREAAAAREAEESARLAQEEQRRQELEEAARRREAEAAARERKEEEEAKRHAELEALAEQQREEAALRAAERAKEREEQEAKAREHVLHERAERAAAAEADAAKAREARKRMQEQAMAAHKQSSSASSSSSAAEVVEKPEWIVSGAVNALPSLQEWTNVVRSAATCPEPVITLVDVTATWCGPCRAIAPNVAAIARDNPDVRVIKVDADAFGELVGTMGVRGFPTFVWFVRAKEAHRHSGANPAQLQQALQTARATAEEIALQEAIAMSAAEEPPAPTPPSATELCTLKTDPESIAVDPDTLAPAPTVGDSLGRALRTLREQCSLVEYLAAIDTLRQSASFLVKFPDNVKYRKVRASNPRFHARVGRHAASRSCMEALGFALERQPVEGSGTETEEVFVFPESDEAARSRVVAALNLLEAVSSEADARQAAQEEGNSPQRMPVSRVPAGSPTSGFGPGQQPTMSNPPRVSGPMAASASSAPQPGRVTPIPRSGTETADIDAAVAKAIFDSMTKPKK
jgi:thioredoxin 1